MIIKEDNLKWLDNLIGKNMKRGFWAGLVAFILAKITHLLVTFAIGLWVFYFLGIGYNTVKFIQFIDSPLVGIIYLVFVTRFIYLKITKQDTIKE